MATLKCHFDTCQMARRVELHADRRLLDASFEGYKLGGGEPPSSRRSLAAPPARPSADLSSQCSLLHARLRALHNGLVRDGTEDRVYYVDAECGVWGARAGPLVAFRVLGGSSRLPGPHPPSLVFVSPARALLSDGGGRLSVLATGERDIEDAPWKVEAELKPSETPFTILDAKCDPDGNAHVILFCIEQDDLHSIGILEWLILSRTENQWQFRPFRKIKCPGVVHHCELESGCEALYLVADRPPIFLKDEKEEPNPEPESKENGKKVPLYCWTQNSDEITLTFRLRPELSSFAPSIDTSKNSINISCNGVELIRGTMFADVEEGLTTWKMDNSGNLTVSMMKREQGKIWRSLLKDGDPNGEQTMDPGYVAEVHDRLAHLCSETEVADPSDAPLFNSQQLEECDFETEEESCLVRMSATTLEVSHRIHLSSHQMILSVQLSSTEALALGLRYDADACIWQPYVSVEGDWTIKHEGTLPAFGYVQSSKQQKKYTVCSPNLEYSIVCEATRHAFIYRRSGDSSQLRQRMSSGDSRRVKIGRQQLITFEREEEILGIHASNEHLFVLTEKNLICYEMC